VPLPVGVHTAPHVRTVAVGWFYLCVCPFRYTVAFGSAICYPDRYGSRPGFTSRAHARLRALVARGLRLCMITDLHTRYFVLYLMRSCTLPHGCYSRSAHSRLYVLLQQRYVLDHLVCRIIDFMVAVCWLRCLTRLLRLRSHRFASTFILLVPLRLRPSFTHAHASPLAGFRFPRLHTHVLTHSFGSHLLRVVTHWTRSIILVGLPRVYGYTTRLRPIYIHTTSFPHTVSRWRYNASRFFARLSFAHVLCAHVPHTFTDLVFGSLVCLRLCIIFGLPSPHAVALTPTPGFPSRITWLVLAAHT